MKILYLETSLGDLGWMKRCYIDVFPQGREKADAQFLATQRNSRENPRIGQPSEWVKGAREFPVARAPFAFVYRIRNENIEVIRVVDNRSGWQKDYRASASQ